MKKHYLRVAVVLTVISSFAMTSCIGNFNLTHKLLGWNKTVGNKFVNELVFIGFCIVGVYPVSVLADIVVLNSIEFWSGKNPVEAGKKVVEGNDGRYLVEWDETGYTIKSENDGSITRLDFNGADNSWSVSVDGGESTKFMTFVDDMHVQMLDARGDYQLVELSQAGVMAFENTAAAQTLFAAR